MRRAFTLIELLVVVAIIGLLLALLLPGLASARQRAKMAVCFSNIRQLALANTCYANENKSRCVPGASDFLHNLNRWHGVRDSISQPFDSKRSPLEPYLGEDRAIRDCPSFDDFRTNAGAFERGCGGYGYNNAFIGVQLRMMGDGSNLYAIETDRAGAILERVAKPVETVMFTDSALASNGLIEYSFAEPRFQPTTGERLDPSIHFRHGGRASVGWADGHAGAQTMSFSWSSGVYFGDPKRLQIGWFGPVDDNGLFDLR